MSRCSQSLVVVFVELAPESQRDENWERKMSYRALARYSGVKSDELEFMGWLITPRLYCASASPCSASISKGLQELEFMGWLITPRLYCASASPCSAAKRNHLTASA